MAHVLVGDIIIGAGLAYLIVQNLPNIGRFVNGSIQAIKYAIEQHEEEARHIIQNLKISESISYHVLTKKHGFNNGCHIPCILSVAKSIKNNEVFYTKNGVPFIRGSGRCFHNCLIEVRMSVPPDSQCWIIGTAFHIKEEGEPICKAIYTGYI